MISPFAIFFITGFTLLNLSNGATNYCSISTCAKSQQTLCLYSKGGLASRCEKGVSSPPTAAQKVALVNKHNEYRRIVANGQEKRGKPGPQPPASNMRKLEWDNELANVAQRYADQCLSGHDKCRNVERFQVGQNIAERGSTPKPDNSPIEDLMAGWYNEVALFDKNLVTNFEFSIPTGHYSALVWADTKYVGCGVIRFQETSQGRLWYKTRLICNYGPAGNVKGQAVYKTGKPASACTNGVSNIAGLCN